VDTLRRLAGPVAAKVFGLLQRSHRS
jgi:hypothetical protein